MKRLTPERRASIIPALCEGQAVNGTARMTGTSKVTILKLLADLGAVCLAYQRERFVNLACRRLQVGEAWSFVHCKENRLRRDERGRGKGLRRHLRGVQWAKRSLNGARLMPAEARRIFWACLHL